MVGARVKVNEKSRLRTIRTESNANAPCCQDRHSLRLYSEVVNRHMLMRAGVNSK